MEVSSVFKFCPRCGTQGRPKGGKLVCSACGLDTYFNPKPVQSVVIKNDNDEYLFTVRAFEPRKGTLDFPGGFVEEGEDFEQATRREAKEELGVKLGRLEYLLTSVDDYLFQGVNYHVSGVAYTARLPKNARLKPADDVAAIEFYKLEDVPVDRLAFPSMRQIIKGLKTKLD